jgi:hypothetical protein
MHDFKPRGQWVALVQMGTFVVGEKGKMGATWKIAVRGRQKGARWEVNGGRCVAEKGLFVVGKKRETRKDGGWEKGLFVVGKEVCGWQKAGRIVVDEKDGVETRREGRREDRGWQKGGQKGGCVVGRDSERGEYVRSADVEMGEKGEGGREIVVRLPRRMTWRLASREGRVRFVVYKKGGEEGGSGLARREGSWRGDGQEGRREINVHFLG